MEISALGGSERKLSFPVLQNGTNAAVFMFPAMRSGRSEKNRVVELIPSKVSLFVDLSKVILFAVWTNRKSACLACSLAVCALAEASGNTGTANAAAIKLRLVITVISSLAFAAYSLNKYTVAPRSCFILSLLLGLCSDQPIWTQS